MPRPESVNTPELFYDERQAQKYSRSSRMIRVQTELTERAIELLDLQANQTPAYVLDIGCGSGLSGQVLEENGISYIGLDISKHMLDIAHQRELDGDLMRADLGDGLSQFRAATFDGVVSISALQWICVSSTTDENPFSRLSRFFTTLFSVLSASARAVFQIYPESVDQLEMITRAALAAGFTGGTVIDYPNSAKRKKVFLCLFTTTPGTVPRAREGDEPGPEVIARERRRKERIEKKRESVKAGRSYVLRKKELFKRRHGEMASIPRDSKYTGRRRPGKL